MREKYQASEKLLTIMQDNLKNIRETLGWTSEDLANLIGVTKQTISNLENNRSKLSKLHFIAIRTVIDYEIECLEEKDSDKAKKAKLHIHLLFNSPRIAEEKGEYLSAEQIGETSQLIAKSNSYETAEKIFTSFIPILVSSIALFMINSSSKKK